MSILLYSFSIHAGKGWITTKCEPSMREKSMRKGRKLDAHLVMPMFGSEPRFEPEPTRTGPRFGSEFKEIAEPNPRSGSRFREWAMGLNLSEPGSNRTFLGNEAGSRGVKISFEMIECPRPSIPKVENSAFVCTVSMMASTL